jgi:hypothetical protein
MENLTQIHHLANIRPRFLLLIDGNPMLSTTLQCETNNERKSHQPWDQCVSIITNYLLS